MMKNLTEVTTETRNYFADTFTVYYLEPTFKDKVTAARKFQNCVNYYLKDKKVEKWPLDYCFRNQTEEERKIILRKYWLKYFSFLLDEQQNIQNINQWIQEEKPIKVGENLGFIRMAFTRIMMKALNEERAENLKQKKE
jgi:hypothetical protein